MRLAALLVFLLPGLVQAQGQNNYGSIYSLYGVGERVEYGSSQSAMMGHANASLRSGTYVGLTNPALWADQAVTTFSAGASLATVRGEDALTQGSSVTTAGDVSSVHLGIPLIPSRLGVAVAYRPYSRVNYRAATAGSISVEDSLESFVSNLEGTGGLQQLTAGVGVRLGSAVQLGASADVLFGTQEFLRRVQFVDSDGNNNNDFAETREARSTRLRGLTATLGAAFTALSLARDDDALTVAGSLTLPTSVDADRSTTLGESLDRDTLRTPDGSLSIDGDVNLPLVARGGISYQSGGRWSATLGGLYEPWSNFESTLPLGGFDSASGVDVLRDRWQVGGGFEITPAGRDPRASALRRTSYRLGAYAERGLYRPEDQNVNTLALTGGFSLPNRFTGARIDLGFELGTRGSATGVLVRDRFLKGTLTINFGERWFIRRQFN